MPLACFFVFFCFLFSLDSICDTSHISEKEEKKLAFLCIHYHIHQNEYQEIFQSKSACNYCIYLFWYYRNYSWVNYLIVREWVLPTLMTLDSAAFLLLCGVINKLFLCLVFYFKGMSTISVLIVFCNPPSDLNKKIWSDQVLIYLKHCVHNYVVDIYSIGYLSLCFIWTETSKRLE